MILFKRSLLKPAFFDGRLFKFGAIAVALALATAASGRPRVEAMMMPAHAAVNGAISQRAADTAKVRAALESRVVKQRLADMGLTENEINQRLGRLSDAQMHQVAMHVEKQNPAGDAGATVLIVVAAIALLALIISLLKHANHDHVDHAEHTDSTTTTTTTQQPAAPAPAAAPGNPGTPQTIIVK